MVTLPVVTLYEVILRVRISFTGAEQSATNKIYSFNSQMVDMSSKLVFTIHRDLFMVNTPAHYTYFAACKPASKASICRCSDEDVKPFFPLFLDDDLSST